MKLQSKVLRLAIAALALCASGAALAADPVRIGFGISRTGDIAPTAAGPLAAY